MTAYTCTISFKDNSKQAVVAPYSPAAPADGFAYGDEISFTSNDGDWSVIYTGSPFDDIGRSRIISAKSGEIRTFLIRQRVTASKVFVFRCVIAVNGHDIGWDSAGGDTRVKTT